MELKNGTSTELNEAIKVIENTIKDIDKEITEGTHSRTMIDNYIKCYNEQKQLLEWLNELKAYREKNVKALENLKADMNENLCSIACEDCQFYDKHFYAKSGCRVTDFIDSHIAEIKGENK